MSWLPIVHPSSRPSQGDVYCTNTKFPAGVVPSAHSNTNPHCNHLALCPAGLRLAISTLNRAAWDFYLTDYLDCKFIDMILNIMDVGASVGHLGLPRIQLCKNLRSALDHKGLFQRKYMLFCQRDTSWTFRETATG